MCVCEYCLSLTSGTQQPLTLTSYNATAAGEAILQCLPEELDGETSLCCISSCCCSTPEVLPSSATSSSVLPSLANGRSPAGESGLEGPEKERCGGPHQVWRLEGMPSDACIRHKTTVFSARFSAVIAGALL